MAYAKIIDGKLDYWRGHITEGGKDIFTNDATTYGYKPLIDTEIEQKDGYIAVFDGYEETETEIRRKWRYEVGMPKDEEIEK